MKPTKKIVYVDMDGVLCNYEAAFLEKKVIQPEVRYPQSQYGFFANLQPIEGALDAYRWLQQHFDVYILSSPSYLNPLCYTEKRVWVEKHLGIDVAQRLILSCYKGLLKGDYLIDDWIHEGFEGEHIHFGTERFPDWNTVMRYLATS